MKSVSFCPVNLIFADHSWLEALRKILNNRRFVLISSNSFKKNGGIDKILQNFGTQCQGYFYDTQPNPTIGLVERIYEQIGTQNFEVIVAIGGGSTLDSAKAFNALCSTKNISFLKEYFANPSLHNLDSIAFKKQIFVPTTAGTGSEVTYFSTIWDKVNFKKYSLAHPSLYAEAAILDATLTVTMPIEPTIDSALDALSHACESIWNHNGSVVSDALATQSISLIFENLRTLTKDLTNLEARQKIQHASLLSGLSITMTKTALAHSISYPLTSELGIPHGLACGFTLGHVLKWNGSSLARINPILTAIGARNVEEGFEKFMSFYTPLGLGTRLKTWIPNGSTIESITAPLLSPGRSENNIRHTTEGNAHDLLLEAYTKITSL